MHDDWSVVTLFRQRQAWKLIVLYWSRQFISTVMNVNMLKFNLKGKHIFRGTVMHVFGISRLYPWMQAFNWTVENVPERNNLTAWVCLADMFTFLVSLIITVSRKLNWVGTLETETYRQLTAGLEDMNTIDPFSWQTEFVSEIKLIKIRVSDLPRKTKSQATKKMAVAGKPAEIRGMAMDIILTLDYYRRSLGCCYYVLVYLPSLAVASSNCC